MATVNLGRVGLVLKGDWDSATAYVPLDVVSHNGSSWAAKANSTNVEPTTEHSDSWQLLANNAEWVSQVEEYLEQAEQYSEAAVKALANQALGYSDQSTYNVGDYVLYNDVLYICKTAVTTAEAWDSTKWEQTYMADSIGDLILVQPSQPTETANKIWVDSDDETEYQVPTYEEFEEATDDIADLKSAMSGLTDLSEMDDDTVTERFLPYTLVGKVGRAQQASYDDGHYVSDANGIGNNNTLSIQTVSVQPGEKYKIKPWSTTVMGVFRKSNTSSAGKISDNAVLIPNSGGEYIVTVPDNAASMLVNVYIADKQAVRAIYLSDSIQIPLWLAQNDRFDTKMDNDSMYGISAYTFNRFIGTNGGFINNKNARCTDYIAIADTAESIRYHVMNLNGALGVAFYDRNKIYIPDSGLGYDSEVPNYSFVDGNLVIPQNAAYYCSCVWVKDGAENGVKIGYRATIASIQKAIDTKESPNTDPVYLYGDSIAKPFGFSGKSCIAFGDSITAGVANEGSGNINAGDDMYIRQFCSAVGLALKNDAVSGSCITYEDDESITSIYSKVTNESDSADFIIISGGTNDYNTGKTVGTFGDATEYTFYGALKLICEYLATNYPNAKVIFITPINVTKDFNGHPKANLNLYRNAIFEVATYYGYNVVNGIDMIPVTKTTGYDDTMINHVDGCHPTIRGHKMYAGDLRMKLC